MTKVYVYCNKCQRYQLVTLITIMPSRNRQDYYYKLACGHHLHGVYHRGMEEATIQSEEAMRNG